MVEYIPTTEEVCEIYWQSGYKTTVEQFDRWLAQVKAEAWDQGHWEGWQNATESLTTDMFGGVTPNPYREETK